MRAGKLRHRITIEHDTADPEAPASNGTVTPNWAALHTNISAEVLQVAGGEQLRGGVQTQATTTHVVRLRYRAGISPKMRVVWGSITLGITRVWDVDGRTRETAIECESAV